ncbi:MAG: response regulator transcription factor [Nevskia sp.]|nr:response regulator transcription factor [Nevskia sp.]
MGLSTVLLVEDDPATRARVSEAIACRPELSLLAAVGTCAEAKEVLDRATPRVLVTDLGLPDGSGIDLIRRVGGVPGSDCMVITIFGDERNVVAALEAGATGYLLKDDPAEDIGAALVRLIDGGSPISAKIARYLVRRFHAGAPDAPPASAGPVDSVSLTERETAVLERIAKGFNYAEVAQSLGMSANTVTSHIKHIYRKLAVHSRSEAVFEAAQLGLIRLR